MGREFWLPEKSIASRQEPCSQVPEHRHSLCRHHIRALPVRIGGFSTFILLSCYSSYRPTSWLNNIQRQRLLLTQDRHSFQSLLLQSCKGEWKTRLLWHPQANNAKEQRNYRDREFSLYEAWFTTGKALQEDDSLCLEENTTKIIFFFHGTWAPEYKI